MDIEEFIEDYALPALVVAGIGISVTSFFNDASNREEIYEILPESVQAIYEAHVQRGHESLEAAPTSAKTTRTP